MKANFTDSAIILAEKVSIGKINGLVELGEQFFNISGLINKLKNNQDDEILLFLNDLFLATSLDSETPEVAAFVLLQLAYDGDILLPFTAESLRLKIPAENPLSIPQFLTEMDTYASSVKPRWLKKDLHSQLILATSCRSTGAFDINTFERLHTWLMSKGSLPLTVSLLDVPYVLLRSIENSDGLHLTREIRHKYILWRASKQDEKVTFEEFSHNPDFFKGMRIHGAVRERVELSEHVQRRNELESKRNKVTRAVECPSPFVQNLLDIAEKNDDDAPKKYYAALAYSSEVKGFRPNEWIKNPTRYPGREHVDIVKLGGIWFATFRSYIAFRLKKWQTDGQVLTALHSLADYLFLYIPWWYEKNPQNDAPFPYAPKDFLRYAYVDRTRYHSEDGQGLILPETLYEVMPLRHTTPEARNIFRFHVGSYFSYVELYFEDAENIVSEDFANPIRRQFDHESVGKRGKTNKVPFTSEVRIFLISYLQSVEAFGEFLQQQALMLNLFAKKISDLPGGYFTEKWGYVPIFWLKGKMYKIDWIPSIYEVARRTIKSTPGETAGVYVQGMKLDFGTRKTRTLNFPHLTIVRLLASMVEIGLRGQGLQWLDRRTFDKYAPPIEPRVKYFSSATVQDYYKLFVNTDKRNDPFKDWMSWRVRRSLLNERDFQNCIVDEFSNVEVFYEGRKQSHFGKIVSLFRSAGSKNPISDSAYRKRWLELLHGFEQFYNRKDGEDRSGFTDALRVVKPRGGTFKPTGNVFKDYLPVHTPHSCRSTVATVLDEYLEVEEIAEQLGLRSTVTVNHYQVPDEDKLGKKLKAIDDKMFADEPYDVAGERPGYLHPEKEGSAVRRAFSADRQQAMTDFGFLVGATLWSLTDLNSEDLDSIKRLQDSPASRIRWHPTHACPVGDECPREVLETVGAMHRCGGCPLAAKCVDNLPAIEAKQSALLERIRATARLLKVARERGDAISSSDALHAQMRLDVREFLGWRLSAEILRSKKEQLGGDDGAYHVDRPELVRLQLQLVTRNRADSEFFLQRIADSNAYPSLESQELRAKAARYTRLLLASQGRFEEAAMLEVPEHTELAVFASMLKPFIAAKKLALSEIAMALEASTSPQSSVEHAQSYLLLG